MNCSQFKDPVSNMCLAGVVVACWSLTQEMVTLSPFTVMTVKYLGKTSMLPFVCVGNKLRGTSLICGISSCEIVQRPVKSKPKVLLLSPQRY